MNRRYSQPTTMPKVFDGMKSDYNAAKSTRFRKTLTGVNAMGSGADYHYRSEADYLRLMELARHFDRNDCIVGQGVTRLVNNVVQDGFQVDPDTGSDELDTALRKRWDDWAESADACDASGEHTLNEIAKQTLRSVIVDGDIFHLLLNSGQVQPVESHRCRTPNNTTRNVVNGVLLDQVTRRHLEYWFTKEDIGLNRAVSRVGDTVQYSVRNDYGERSVLHVYNPKRYSQTRGVTAFAAITDMVGMHDDIQFAKLVQQQVTSCVAIIRERAENFGGGMPVALGSESSDTQTDGAERTLQELAPGLEIVGEPGEKITGFSPDVPNAQYFEHVHLVLSIIAVNLEIPVMVLLLDPSETNFSGWRGAMDQARYGFKALQGMLANRFYVPTYRWKVREWLVRDEEIQRLAQGAGINPLKHCWSPPTWAYIQPEIEAKADRLICNAGLNSRRAVLGRRGLSIEDVDRDIIADNARLIRAAKQTAVAINAEFDDGAPVRWEQLIALDPLESGAKAPAVADPSNDPMNDPASGQPSKPQKRSNDDGTS